MLFLLHLQRTATATPVETVDDQYAELDDSESEGMDFYMQGVCQNTNVRPVLGRYLSLSCLKYNYYVATMSWI